MSKYYLIDKEAVGRFAEMRMEQYCGKGQSLSPRLKDIKKTYLTAVSETLDGCRPLPSREEIAKVVQKYCYQIDADAKGIYIGELEIEWGEKQDGELADKILELLNKEEK
jgi:hypothetical protein